MARLQESKKNKVKEESNKTVPFYKLFSFADSWDYLLMFVGTMSALANGMIKALMNIVLGDAIDAFRGNDNTKVVHEVSKVSLKFVLIGAGAFLAAFLQVACWVSTGERQAARIRGLYLKAILRQDISLFDKETNTGEVVGRMSGDTILIQEAMGEKVEKFIQCVACFFGGVVIAFIRGWLLTLVLLSCIPPLVLSGSIMSFAFAKLASRGQAAYSEAATVVEQTIGSIRTEKPITQSKPSKGRSHAVSVVSHAISVDVRRSHAVSVKPAPSAWEADQKCNLHWRSALSAWNPTPSAWECQSYHATSVNLTPSARKGPWNSILHWKLTLPAREATPSAWMLKGSHAISVVIHATSVDTGLEMDSPLECHATSVDSHAISVGLGMKPRCQREIPRCQRGTLLTV